MSYNYNDNRDRHRQAMPMTESISIGSTQQRPYLSHLYECYRWSVLNEQKTRVNAETVSHQFDTYLNGISTRWYFCRWRDEVHPLVTSDENEYHLFVSHCSSAVEKCSLRSSHRWNSVDTVDSSSPLSDKLITRPATIGFIHPGQMTSVQRSVSYRHRLGERCF